MDISAREFRRRARIKLSNNFFYVLLAVIVYGALMSIGSPIAIVIAGGLTIGMSNFFLHLADRKNLDIADLFVPFKNQFGNSIAYFLLYAIYIALWSLLFVIPGLIAGFSYSMTPYILAEHPEMSASDALKLSADMMKGNKSRLFWLSLSFTGWFLLSILTCGFGFFYVVPYMYATYTEFFNEISGKNAQRGTFDPAEYNNAGFTGGYSAPQNGGYSAPQNGGYSAQQNGGYSAQQNGGYSAPQNGGFSAPQNGGYSAPQNGGYSAPQNGGYSAPQNGGYSAPQNGGFSAPQNGGYSAPQNGGYSAPQNGGYSAPQNGGYSAPQNGGYPDNGTGSFQV